MKMKFVLLLSVGLNVALFAGYWLRRPAPPAILSEDSEETAEKPTLAGRIRETRATPGTQVLPQEIDIDWSTVESADYKEYIENLRRIGCPEETVRDIIIADINKLYASKMLGLYPSPKDFKFWRVEDRAARNEERDRDRQRRVLETEKRDLIEELLGVDYETELARWSGKPDEDNWRYGFLSPEKQAEVQALSERFRDQERALWGEGNGGWTAENRAKFTALRAQREADLAQILGPAEFKEYQLRNSWTARNMRENLTAFQPSEDEFKQVFDARKAYDDQFGFTRGGGDAALQEQRRLAQANLDDILLGVLGEQRFADYKKSQNEDYRDIYDFTQRQNLPRQTADTLYQVRQAAEQEQRRIQDDATLTAEARQAALQNLSTTTLGALGQTLGPEGLEEYQGRAGRWMRQLASGGGGGGDRRGGDRERGRGR